MVGVVHARALEQDALREWFVSWFNRLADHLLRWQNFMTRSGELRPMVQQHTKHDRRSDLYASAHLLASGERRSRLADFWQLVDLYASLQSGGIPRLFSEKCWEETIVAAPWPRFRAISQCCSRLTPRGTLGRVILARFVRLARFRAI